MLKIKTEQVANAEKKLASMMMKRTEVQSSKNRAGPAAVRTFGQKREELSADIDVKVGSRDAKNAIAVMLEQRADLARQIKSTKGEKKRARLERDKARKTAEIAQLQGIIAESDSYPNPISAKKLVLKDVGEARKIIEFLFDQLVEHKSSANINELRVRDSEEQTKKLKSEMDLQVTFFDKNFNIF